MRRLLLLRHAKAVQDSGEDDFARALNERGHRDSALMGHALDTHGYIPDFVACSSSRRTKETWELLSLELARVPKVEFTKELYLASPRNIIAAVQNTNEGVKTLMLVGHNPGVKEAAVHLARRPASKAEAKKLEDMREKFPTCALAVLDFDVEHWSDVTGAGILLEFIRPRDLKN
jgi:phosphohistidine phosphatase